MSESHAETLANGDTLCIDADQENGLRSVMESVNFHSGSGVTTELVDSSTSVKGHDPNAKDIATTSMEPEMDVVSQTRNDINDNHVRAKDIGITVKEQSNKIEATVRDTSFDGKDVCHEGSSSTASASFSGNVNRARKSCLGSMTKSLRVTNTYEDSGFDLSWVKTEVLEDSDNDDDDDVMSPGCSTSQEVHDPSDHPRTDNEPNNSLTSYAKKYLEALNAKRENAKYLRKRHYSPFQYLCKHADRTLLYSMFGNAVDGFVCSLCHSSISFLPKFLNHMRVHADLLSLLEDYLRLGGRVVPLRGNNPRRNASSTRDLRVQSQITSASRTSSRCVKPMQRMEPAGRTRKSSCTETGANSGNETAGPANVEDGHGQCKMANKDPQPIETSVSSSTPQEFTLRSPDLPTLDITNEQSLKFYVKAFCSYISDLQPKLRAFRKNGITVFEILSKFMDKKLVHDIFKRKKNQYVCLYCKQSREHLQRIVLHVRGHGDQSLLLEMYLRRGGVLYFDEDKPILPNVGSWIVTGAVDGGSDAKATVESSVVGESSIGLRPDRKRLSWKMSTKRLLEMEHAAEPENRRKKIREDATQPQEANARSRNVPMDNVLEHALLKDAIRTPDGHGKSKGLSGTAHKDTNSISDVKAKKKASLTVEPLRAKDRPEDVGKRKLPLKSENLPRVNKFRGMDVSTKTRRNDGFCAKAMEPRFFNMLRSIVEERITKENPHFCMFCGKPFYGGNGLYIHYYQHKRVHSKASDSTSAEMELDTSTENSHPNESVHEENKCPVGSAQKDPSAKDKSPKCPESAVRSKPNMTSTKRIPKRKINVEAKHVYKRPFPSKLLAPKTLNMIRRILNRKITKEKPHLCKFCGHAFYSGSGVSAHYLTHERKMAEAAKGEVVHQNASKDCLESVDKKAGVGSPKNAAAQTPVRVSSEPSPKRKSDVTKTDAPRGRIHKSLAKKRNHDMPFPTKVLDLKTLRMLQTIIKKKITVLNPHFCKHCGKRFESGCGLYMHYYLHWNALRKSKQKGAAPGSSAEASKPSEVRNSSSSPSVKSPKSPMAQDSSAGRLKEISDIVLEKQLQAASYNGTSNFLLDSRILRMLRGIAKEITPENPHVCAFCHHVFHNGRGMYMHYLRHVNLNSKGLPSTSGTVTGAPSSRSHGHDVEKCVVEKGDYVAKSSKSVKGGRNHASPKNKMPRKYYPTQDLDRATFGMLKRLILRKITKEKPHFCKFCSKPFYSGCGLYFHYLKHKNEQNLRAGEPGSTKSSPASNTVHGTDRGELKSEQTDDDCISQRSESNAALCELQYNTNKLLYCLAKDAYVLKELGWPQRDVSEVLMEILKICQVVPVEVSGYSSDEQKLWCLRENVQKLTQFCIAEEAMVKHGWKNRLVDDVIKDLVENERELTMIL